MSWAEASSTRRPEKHRIHIDIQTQLTRLFVVFRRLGDGDHILWLSKQYLAHTLAHAQHLVVAQLIQLLLIQQTAGQNPLTHIVEIVEQPNRSVYTEANALLVDKVQPGLTNQLQDQLEYDNVLGGTYGGQIDLVQHIAHIEALLIVVVNLALPETGGRKTERKVGQAEDSANCGKYLNTLVGGFLED